jgi:hypothetical protein
MTAAPESQRSISRQYDLIYSDRYDFSRDGIQEAIEQLITGFAMASEQHE